jgi:hypothetical protein
LGCHCWQAEGLAILDWLFADIEQLCAHFVLDRRE